MAKKDKGMLSEVVSEGKVKGFFGALKATLIPTAIAILCVGMATRWAKKDEKTGKYTWTLPAIAVGLTMVPGLVFKNGWGIFTKSYMVTAGAIAFLLAWAYDDVLKPLLGSDNPVSMVFGWGESLAGKKDDEREVPKGGHKDGGDGVPDKDKDVTPDASEAPAPSSAAAAATAPAASSTGAIAGAVGQVIGAGLQALPGIISALGGKSGAATQQAGAGAGLNGNYEMGGMGNGRALSPYFSMVRR